MEVSGEKLELDNGELKSQTPGKLYGTESFI